MKTIGRRITTSECRGIIYSESEGNFTVFADKLLGDYTPERATRACRRIYNNQTITVSEVTKRSAYYKAPLNEFLKIAKATDWRDE
nr:MAG TPA: Histone-like Protein p6 [Bacteriophage sp.]